MPKKIYIFDTTLRDGEQTPGVSLRVDEKIDVALQLDKLGVDVIEAGFPAASKGEAQGVKKISHLKLRAKICGLARTKKEDIDAAIKADVDRVHTFIGTSELHLKYKLKLSEEEAIKKAVESVEYVKAHGLECEFSAEDASRTNIGFLCKIYSATISAGADIINIPDTVGVLTPEKAKFLISKIKKAIPKPISAHFHNDFGLAVANSIAAIESGAEQVHCTVNGLGERAGNASLEQLATILYTFYNIKTINLGLIAETSELVEKYTRVLVSQTAPIIGRNAFAHESGIHVHGVLQKAETYEPISPELVGRKREIFIGKHSGAHSIRAILKSFGIDVQEEQLSQIMKKIKEIGDKGEKIGERELVSITDSIIGRESKKTIKLKEFAVLTGSQLTPTASVRVEVEGKDIQAASIGVGPIDAVTKALQKALGKTKPLKLVKYRIDSVGTGTETVGEVFIKLVDKKGNTFFARGIDDDIVKASIDAFVDGYSKGIRKTL